MYGLLCLNANCLSSSEQSVAKSHLCGLCNSLSSKYGFGFRALTNHDATFISILHSAQSKSKIPRQNCFFRLQKPKSNSNAGLEYASAISLLMAKVKIDDSIDDDDSKTSRLAAKIIDAKVHLAVNSLENSGFKTQAIFSEARRQKAVENNPSSDLNELTIPTENGVSQIFSHTATLANKTSNLEPLSILGKNIGRLMYLADSYVDLPKDNEKGRFNALSHCFPQKSKKQLRKKVEQLSCDAINEISQSVKSLELHQHERIITEGLLPSLKNRLNVLLSPTACSLRTSTKFSDRFSIGSAMAGTGPGYCSSIRCGLIFEYLCGYERYAEAYL